MWYGITASVCEFRQRSFNRACKAVPRKSKAVAVERIAPLCFIGTPEISIKAAVCFFIRAEVVFRCDASMHSLAYFKDSRPLSRTRQIAALLTLKKAATSLIATQLRTRLSYCSNTAWMIPVRCSLLNYFHGFKEEHSS